MLLLLPLVAFVLTRLAFREYGHDWRQSLIFAMVACGAAVVLITESLSFWAGLSWVGLSLAWTAAILLSFVLWITKRRTGQVPADASLTFRRGGELMGLLSASAILVLLVGIVALMSPPNTYDAMVYHMPRVAMWAINETVEFYPTHVYQQLFMPPWAEYAMLHTFILSGGDRFVNLVQWLALLGSALAVSGIASSLGAGVRGQVYAVVACVTIPQGVLEGSGAKNDWVTALWLALFTLLVLRFREQPTWAVAIGLSAAFGLALSTKGTTYLFAPAVCAPILLAAPREVRRLLLRRAPVLLVIILMILGPHYLRNLQFSGSPLGSFDSFLGTTGDWKGVYRFSNDALSPNTTASNVLRNISLHIATPDDVFNQRLQGWVETALASIGANPNDPASTWHGTVFQFSGQSKHESLQGNGIHLLLLTAAFAYVFWPRGSHAHSNRRTWKLYAVGLLAAFLVFCALLRWQPWHTRLHLPLFVLGSALIGVCLERMRPAFLASGLAILLLMLATPHAVENRIRALLYDQSILNKSRMSMYFADLPFSEDAYASAVAAVQNDGCQTIGIDSSLREPVYPLLVMLLHGQTDRKIRFVGVENQSAMYGDRLPSREPCAIICNGCVTEPERWSKYESAGARASFFGDTVLISSSGSTTSEGSGSGCLVRFGGGWYPREGDASDWWYWSAEKGSLEVFSTEATTATLRSEFMSQPMPNIVQFLVNGLHEKAWQVGPQLEIELQLDSGQNTIELVSRELAREVPNDPRPLAIGLRNVSLSISGSGTKCAIAF